MKLIISDVSCVMCHVWCVTQPWPNLDSITHNAPALPCSQTPSLWLLTHFQFSYYFSHCLKKTFSHLLCEVCTHFCLEVSLFLFLCNVCLVLLTSISIPKPASVFWNAIFLRKLSIIYSSRCQCRPFVSLDLVSASDVKLTNRQLKVRCV